MNEMYITYFILVASFAIFILEILSYKQSKEKRIKPFKIIFSLILFLMSIYAVIKGIPVTEVKYLIEDLIRS